MKFKIAIFLFLCFFFLTTSSQGQTTKGVWTTGGSIGADRSKTEDVDPEFTIKIAPELGYVFHDKWMVIGKFHLERSKLFRQHGYGMSLYYTYYNSKNLQGYLGMDYEWSKSRVDISENRLLFITETKIAPVLGYLIFLQPKLAFDFSGRYVVYYKESSVWNLNPGSNETEKQNGLIGVDLSLRFFFGEKLRKDSVMLSNSTDLGRWMVGGLVHFGGNESRFLGRYKNDAAYANQLKLFGARRVGKNWMLGSRFNLINYRDLKFVLFEANPFLQYYFSLKPKYRFYGELNAAAEFRFNYSDPGKKANRIYKEIGLGIGWNKRLAAQVFFDLSAGIHLQNRQTFVDDIKERNLYMQFGLAYFLN